MKTLLQKLKITFRQHPTSVISYILLMSFCYLVVLMIKQVHDWSRIHPEGYGCMNGQAYGFILASFFLLILLIGHTVQALIKKNKTFYIRMIYLLLGTAILLYLIFKFVI